MTVTLSAVLFYAGQRQAASVARIREGMDVAATLGSDPLRGDPLSPEVGRVADVACLLRATAAEPEPEADVPETVAVLAPGELTAAQTRDRAGMAGTVLVLAALYAVAVGVLWAWAGGVL